MMMTMLIVTVKTILLVVRITFRSLKKKVGEYQKLTGELPGIWRLAIIGHQPSIVLLPSATIGHQPSAVLLPSAINHSFTFHRKLKSALCPRIAQESFARAEAAEKLLKESKDKVSSFFSHSNPVVPGLKKGRSDCDCVRSSRLSFFNRNPKRTVPSPANRSPT